MSMQKTGKEINRKINQGEDLQSKDRMPKTKSYKKNELIILEINGRRPRRRKKRRLGFFRERQRDGRRSRSQNLKGEKELRLCQGGETSGSIPLPHHTSLSCRGKMRRLSVATFIL